MTKFDYVHRLLQKQILKKKEILITIESDSMFPILKRGDKVIVCSSDTYSIGDIIVFRPLLREHYISHRIIWVSKKCDYYTKGDNSHMYDEKVDKSRILGKIVGIVGKDEKIEYELNRQKPIGIISLMEIVWLFPLIIIPGVWIKRIKIMRLIHKIYYNLVLRPLAERVRRKNRVRVYINL